MNIRGAMLRAVRSAATVNAMTLAKIIVFQIGPDRTGEHVVEELMGLNRLFWRYGLRVEVHRFTSIRSSSRSAATELVRYWCPHRRHRHSAWAPARPITATLFVTATGSVLHRAARHLAQWRPDAVLEFILEQFETATHQPVFQT